MSLAMEFIRHFGKNEAHLLHRLKVECHELKLMLLISNGSECHCMADKTLIRFEMLIKL